jgi:LAS superfamily LD-carboxypeptidase LdcB
VNEVSENFLLGKDAKNLVELTDKILLLPETIKAFHLLKLKADKEGFDLKIISAYRSYDSQKNIWQQKAQGLRPLLDDHGQELEFDQLNEAEILKAIIRWSAIPGASRHHWGTDFDIIDQRALGEHHQVHLTPQEVAPEGIFGPLHLWLDQLIAKDQAYGFFRPYDFDRGGVAPEKWHLSFRPLSEKFLQLYSFDLFSRMIEQSDLLLKEQLLDQREELYQNYLLNICP